jgi:uncharacterized protein YfaS (alpha-2-macroglobulin family)
MQRNNDAERIIAGIPWSRQKGDLGDEVYYDPVVHDAQLLYILARHFPARLSTVPPSVLEDLAAAAGANRLDSLSAAWTLLALDAYSKTVAAVPAKFATAEVGRDGKVQFAKQSPLPAYYAINESGFDRNPPAAAASQGIEIIHEFLDLAGNPIARVKVGDEFLVRLRLRSTTRPRVPQIAVVDLLPGGTEPVLELATDSSPSSALPIGLPAKSTWLPQHVDVRDDRLVLYGDITKDAVAFTYRVRATNGGAFAAPPAFAESLYSPQIFAFSLPARLEVK